MVESSQSLLETYFPDLNLINRGKVRDIYGVPEDDSVLLFVATDRVSAFDVVMKNGIPNKGKLLTKLSEYWFDILPIRNHLITTDVFKMPPSTLKYQKQLEGRTMLVRKCQIIKVEAIVREYLTGSALVEYKKNGTVHGMKKEIGIPDGMVESQKFPKAIFTPSTKAEIGDHDENISTDKLRDIIPNAEIRSKLIESALKIFQVASQKAKASGLLLADTKFEFGLLKNNSEDGAEEEIILADEVLTPDSSRFWLESEWKLGKKMTGLDKQFLREWLKRDDSNWDGKTSLIIPEDVVLNTWRTYKEAYKRVTGSDWVD